MYPSSRLPKIAVLVIGIGSIAPLCAQTYYEDKERGWHWGEWNPPVEPEKEKPKKQVPPPPSPPKAPVAKPDSKPRGETAFTVAWLEKNMPVYLNRAIDNPTRQNVTAYLYLSRLARDKSQRFSDMASEIGQRDPMLDEMARRSQDTFAAKSLDRQANKARKKLLVEMQDRAGLYFFYRNFESCDLCKRQSEVLSYLNSAYGIPVIPVSMDGSPAPKGFGPAMADYGQARQMGVFSYPAMVMGTADGRKTLIAQGGADLNTLEHRMILAARDMGIISKTEYANTRPIHDPDRLLIPKMNNVPKEVLSDPDRLVEWIANTRQDIGEEGGHSQITLDE